MQLMQHIIKLGKYFQPSACANELCLEIIQMQNASASSHHFMRLTKLEDPSCSPAPGWFEWNFRFRNSIWWWRWWRAITMCHFSNITIIRCLRILKINAPVHKPSLDYVYDKNISDIGKLQWVSDNLFANNVLIFIMFPFATNLFSLI